MAISVNNMQSRVSGLEPRAPLSKVKVLVAIISCIAIGIIIATSIFISGDINLPHYYKALNGLLMSCPLIFTGLPLLDYATDILRQKT